VASALLRFLDTDKLLGLPKLRRKDKKILRNILLSLIHAMLGKEREFFVLLYRHYGFVDADIRQCTSLTWGKRLRALKRLDELEEPSLESLFYNLASDSHPLVALSALESLSKISQQINPKRLMPILKNRTKDHKFAAIEIVLNLVRCQGIESLLNVLEEEVLDEYTLGLGIEALGVLRRIESLPTLLKLAEMNLSAENKFRLLRAIRGLGKLDNLSFYSNHLRDQNPKVRAEALKGLKASGNIPETDLVYALSDESVEVRRLVSTISSTEDRGTM
jgi:HEAT repeat protein